MNRDELVPVYRNQIMIPFRSVYRFNVSHPVPNTTGLERYRLLHSGGLLSARKVFTLRAEVVTAASYPGFKKKFN
ncbi:hypothetical protein H5410_037656 [Solanum commersonii]|uniref:Uncharacterized protein n=1 Tax=Solanum commersonii TaxID=4109 RepID=A0A9J5YA47_SOLCO|nr:hypothetical protein H5410_037656 [Solanum commersonii]